MNRPARRFATLCLAMVSALGATAFLPLGASADSSQATAAGPQVQAFPASDLSDGQFIRLHFSGFYPNHGIAFRECIPNAITLVTDCALPQRLQGTFDENAIMGVTDGNGTGETYVPVHTGKLTTVDTKGTIQCDVAHPCVIAALTDANNFTNDKTQAETAFTPVTFAPSKDDCPAPSADAILGQGSASAYRAIYRWESAVCAPPRSLSVGYTLSNSPDGIANLDRGLVDFAVAGPVAQEPVPPATLSYRRAPMTASAVVLAYRMYDTSGGQQITDLTLTPDLIAKIFLGRIPTSWNAPNTPDTKEIVKDNPNTNFPARIKIFARAEHSAQTLVFTSWLARAAPNVWTNTGPNAAPELPRPDPAHPTVDTSVTDTYAVSNPFINMVSGSEGVGLNVANPLTSWFDEGNIGFMDSSTAAFYGLPTVKIKRADGAVVAATTSAISKAITDAKVRSDGTLNVDYANPDPAAYPMPMPAYLLAPTNTITPARGAQLAGFLRYAVKDGQGNLPAGYAPLPPTLVDQGLKVADLIPQPPPPSPPPTSGPVPTPVVGPVIPSPPPLGMIHPLGPILPGLTGQQRTTFAHPPVTPLRRTGAPGRPVACTASTAPTAPAIRGASTPQPAPAPTSSAARPAQISLPVTSVRSGCTARKPTAAQGTARGVPKPTVVKAAGFGFTQLGDWTIGRIVLPAVIGIGLLGLGCGAGVEFVARRRPRTSSDGLALSGDEAPA